MATVGTDAIHGFSPISGVRNGRITASKSSTASAPMQAHAFLETENGIAWLAEDGELVTGKLVSTVLGYLRERYSYIVADAGADFREATLTMLDNSSTIFLPVSADLAALRSTSVALTVFNSLGYDKEKVRLILSPVVQKRASCSAWARLSNR